MKITEAVRRRRCSGSRVGCKSLAGLIDACLPECGRLVCWFPAPRRDELYLLVMARPPSRPQFDVVAAVSTTKL